MDNKKEEKALGIIGLIALRKSDLYDKILEETSKNSNISNEDKNKIKRYISEMKNECFLSLDEKQDKKIRKELKIEELTFDFKEIIRSSLK